MTRVEFLVDGAVLGAATASPWNAAWTVPAAPGVHVLAARATDAAGARALSDPVSVYAAADSGAAPALEIASPLDGATVTAPALFTGTVSSAALRDWHLDYRRLSDVCQTWVTFASGTAPVSGGPLGTLDTSLLRNGLYEIQLVARDFFGRQQAVGSTLLLDGGLKVGHFTVAFNDLTVPLGTVPITVTRGYDSRDHCPGDFGLGWNLDIDSVHLTQSQPLGEGWFYQVHADFNNLSTFAVQEGSAHVISIVFPDGKTYRFQPRAVYHGTYPGEGSAFGNDTTRIYAWSTADPFQFVFDPLPGTQGTLTPRGTPASVYLADSSAGDITWTTQPDDWFATPFRDAGGFLFTAQDGRQLEFDANGRLTKMTERNGQALTFLRDPAGALSAIQHANGRSISFTRDAAGRIMTIADPLGQALPVRLHRRRRARRRDRSRGAGDRFPLRRHARADRPGRSARRTRAAQRIRRGGTSHQNARCQREYHGLHPLSSQPHRGGDRPARPHDHAHFRWTREYHADYGRPRSNHPRDLRWPRQ